MKVSKLKILVTLTAIFAFTSFEASGDIRLPGFYNDHMVLQRNEEIPLWGWAAPGERVTVGIDNGNTITTVTGKNGKWQLKLASMPAGGPHTISIKGNNAITLSDILIGDVWLCSGQSNMQWRLNQSLNAKEHIANAKYPKIRLVTIPMRISRVALDDTPGNWQICSPDTAGKFSAVGYYFGEYLHGELDIPIGLVNSSWGGTKVEPWTPPVGFKMVTTLNDIYKKLQRSNPKSPVYKKKIGQHITNLENWITEAKESIASGKVLTPNPIYPAELNPKVTPASPTVIYNAMIHPLTKMPIKGAIWYQGESNHLKNDGLLYRDKKEALIKGWRKLWGKKDLPFYYVQLAPFNYRLRYNLKPHKLAEFWEAQAKVMEIPNAAMAVINDIGNVKDIHPRNKKPVGKRLGLLALSGTYNKKGIISSGATFKSMAIEGDKLRVRFTSTGGKLSSRDGKKLNWFEIVGLGGEFKPAEAVIDGDSILLSSKEIENPRAMRFAWHGHAEPNLINAAGLPTSAFRAGKVPKPDCLATKVKEAASYKLVYDLDLENLSRNPKYSVNNCNKIKRAFDRIAYILELKKPGQPIQFVYVSMDAFTDDLSKIGLPTVKSKAQFQQKLRNLNIISNVKGIICGEGIDQGNIEFWPHNYLPANSARTQNASETKYDFGDKPVAPAAGHGSMQIHNFKAKQTLFAINAWHSVKDASIGIGNSPGAHSDWTFIKNANEYSVKRLRVLVR